MLRDAGAVGGMVLLDVALDAQADLVARTSARLIGDHLGLSPTMAARALRALRRRDLLATVPSPEDGDRFGLTCYRLVTGIAGLTVVAPCAASPHAVNPRTGAVELPGMDW